MAYAYFVNKFHATFLAWHNDVRDLLVSAGWSVYDTQATFTCLRSDGDVADGVYIYVKVFNNAGSMHYGSNYAATVINGNSIGATIAVGAPNSSYLYADKNGFISFSASGTVITPTQYQGVLKVTPKAGSWKTTTTGSVTPVASTPVNIPVADTANFVVGMYYHYYDFANGKHNGFRLISKSVPSGAGNLSAILGTATGAMASGSWVGINPYPVITWDQSYGPTSLQHFYPTYAGVATSQCYVKLSRYYDENVALQGLAYQLFSDILENPVGECRLFDVEMVEYANTTINAQAYLGSSSFFKLGLPMYTANTLGLAANINNLDAKGFGLQVSSASTGPNTNTTLQDTAKTWTVNQWAGKVLITTSGAAAGQIAKIISNTATILTTSAMQFTPDATGTYVICDEGYRIINKATSNAYYLKEGI